MVRRCFDICVSLGALLVAGPVILGAALGIRFSSPGPVLYRAQRVGQKGRLFTMLKLRTMHCREVSGSSITASNDQRVFALGRLLRALKIDELPQLINVLRGDMAIVGPRPEAPDIVDRYYSAEDRKSLAVAPGLTSPGSIFYYTHGEQLLADGDAEHVYASRLLPVKMAIDLNYLQRSSLASDVLVMARTAITLLRKALGQTQFPEPREYARLKEHGQPAESSRKVAA